ncbi:restriction endonuclease subunit S [Nitrospira sp. CMX1]
MRKGWQTKKLGDVCATIQDGAHESPQRQFDSPGKGRFLYITSKNIRNNCLDLGNVSYVEEDFHSRIYPRCKPSIGDVLLTKDGANTGNVTLNTLDEPFSLLSSVCLIKTKPDALSPGFLSYYIQSPDGLKSITGQMTGAAIKRIILRDIKLAPIPIPPLPEQHRIVGILDEAFDGLARATANAEQNLRNARALFESHVQAVFSEAWRDSEVVPLTELASDITDGDHLPPPKTSTGIPFITIGNIVKSSRKIDFSDTYKVSRDYFDSLKPNRRPQRGDVLYTVTGSFGIPVLIDDWQEFCFQRHIGLIRPKSRVDSRWLSYLMLSPQVFAQADAAATGAAQRTVSLKALRSFVVPSMSLIRQEKMAAQLDALAAETQRLESIYQRKLAALGELKKSLLHQAFTGQL